MQKKLKCQDWNGLSNCLHTAILIITYLFTFLCLCRWIIQKAFYYPKAVGRYGCSGISWRDLFLFCPTLSQPKIQAMGPKQALHLDDLDDFSPTYMGCATINRLRRTFSPKEAHYEVLTMTPDGIERLERLGGSG